MDSNLRVSDEERDQVVERLRGHLMAGRLDADEYEERVEEACRARFGRDLEHALRELPPPPAPAPVHTPPVFVKPSSRSGAAVPLGLSALIVLLFTGGFASILALPLGIAAWVSGKRHGSVAGRVLGIVTTTLSLLALLVLTLVMVAFAGFDIQRLD